jgi:uncharacterized membrane protein YeiB
VWVLINQKAWEVFAFLFGVGFAVLLRRLDAGQEPVIPILRAGHPTPHVA